MRTLILSDLHLGSRNCHATQVLRVLERESFDRLILNGDTINSVNLRKLTPSHWAVIDRLRRVAISRELILMRGNHDDGRGRGLAPYFKLASAGSTDGCDDNDQVPQTPPFGAHDVLPSLLGVPMRDEYFLDISCRPYLVLHGDRFDPTLHYPLVTEMADWCYQLTQKINKKLAKWLKKKSKRWGGVLESVRCQAIAYARQQGFAGVVTGHTHYADDLHMDGVHYMNAGCWTESPCAYITVESDQARLHQIPA
jgi:UDP-2,3-diacylglucosamine pyrophosphatase LpxH